MKYAVPILVILLGATAVLAQPLLPLKSASATFNVTAATMSSANVVPMSSPSYRLIAIAGEQGTSMSSSNYQLCLGWWCGLNTVPYNISISGRLNYADGRPVVNAPLTLSVWNTTRFTYNGQNKTAGDGSFSLAVRELPETLFDTGYFTLEVRASGEVEAAYRCMYNVSSGVCKKV